jgi:hypothetical protein
MNNCHICGCEVKNELGHTHLTHCIAALGQKIAALEATNGGTMTLKVPEYDTILERLTAIESRITLVEEVYDERLRAIERKVFAHASN